MSDEAKKPRLPEVGEYVRMFGTLVEVQDVTPPPPAKVLDFVFEDTEGRVEVLANGKLLKEGGTYCNAYGKDSSVESAISEAKQLAAAYGDGVEVRAVKVTRRVRMRPVSGENFYDREFSDFRSLERGARWDLPEPVEEVVWTSKAEARV